ncbi:MAG TPA: YceI family protein [Verrucomicrobiae bacterium]|nr:YceI family protein [Verrucomicrobiae bacterium]
MKSPLNSPALLSCLAVSVLLTACSDPSENVHKSDASGPVAATAPTTATGREFALQPDSRIGFVGSKVTGSHVGGFTNFTGSLLVADGKVVGSPEFKIDMNSTWSDNDRLTGHLKNADFFDVPNHPTTTFTITTIEPGATNSTVTGNLDLRGVTKSISFPAAIQVGADAVTVKAEFAINRKDFNILYTGRADDLIRDNVVIQLDLKAAPKG